MSNLNKTDVVESIESVFGEVDSRWYQIAAMNGVAAELERNPQSRIILKMPTGAGKTHSVGLIITSPAVASALGVKDRPLRILFVAHVRHLLTQAFRAYSKEASISVIETGTKAKHAEDAKVQILLHSAFSDVPDDAGDFDLIVIDEGHHEPMQTLQKLHDKNGDLPMILVTATDSRLDGMMIKADCVVEPITRDQAVAEGYLARTHLRSFVDGSGRDKSKMICDIYDKFHDQFGQTIMYVRTKKEMRAIVKHIEDHGLYSVVGLDQQTPKQVTEIVDKFSAGEYNIIVNCSKLSEGIDVKMCQSVFIGRNLQSYVLLNQIIGRAARPDCDAYVWELINPLAGDNLDTTVVVGTPDSRQLFFKENKQWHNLDIKVNPKLIRA